MQEKQMEKQEKKKKENNKQIIVGLLLLFIMVIAVDVIAFIGFKKIASESVMQENELQQIVEEVKQEVNNGNFEEAYLKAKSIDYTKNLSTEIDEKWDKTRKEMIDYVIREEKKATGKSEHKSESSFWDNFFK